MAIEKVDAIDKRRSNTVRNRLFGLQFVCLTGDKWKILTICDPRSSIVQSLLDSRLGMSVTTQSGSGRQSVGSGRQYVTGS